MPSSTGGPRRAVVQRLDVVAELGQLVGQLGRRRGQPAFEGTELLGEGVDSGLQGGGGVGLGREGILELLRSLVVAAQRLVEPTDLRLHPLDVLGSFAWFVGKNSWRPAT